MSSCLHRTLLCEAVAFGNASFTHPLWTTAPPTHSYSHSFCYSARRKKNFHNNSIHPVINTTVLWKKTFASDGRFKGFSLVQKQGIMESLPPSFRLLNPTHRLWREVLGIGLYEKRPGTERSRGGGLSQVNSWEDTDAGVQKSLEVNFTAKTLPFMLTRHPFHLPLLPEGKKGGGGGLALKGEAGEVTQWMHGEKGRMVLNQS